MKRFKFTYIKYCWVIAPWSHELVLNQRLNWYLPVTKRILVDDSDIKEWLNCCLIYVQYVALSNKHGSLKMREILIVKNKPKTVYHV